MKKINIIILTIILVAVTGFFVAEGLWANKLVLAVKQQDVNVVEKMVSHKGLFSVNRGTLVPIVTATSYPQRALVVACEEGDPKMVKLLLKAGADPNKAGGGEYGVNQPLVAATTYIDDQALYPVVKGLLQYGADANVQRAAGEASPLLLTTEISVISYERDGERCTGVDMELARTVVKTYRLLLEKTHDKNPVDVNGRTPLHWAAYMLNEPLVRYLVEEQGVSVNEEDAEGLTPAQFCKQGRDESDPFEVELTEHMLALLHSMGQGS